MRAAAMPIAYASQLPRRCFYANGGLGWCGPLYACNGLEAILIASIPEIHVRLAVDRVPPGWTKTTHSLSSSERRCTGFEAAMEYAGGSRP